MDWTIIDNCLKCKYRYEYEEEDGRLYCDMAERAIPVSELGTTVCWDFKPEKPIYKLVRKLK